MPKERPPNEQVNYIEYFKGRQRLEQKPKHALQRINGGVSERSGPWCQPLCKPHLIVEVTSELGLEEHSRFRQVRTGEEGPGGQDSMSLGPRMAKPRGGLT